jgi:hypothetical protein
MNTWQKSHYGSRLSFCDSATLVDVRKMWGFYLTERSGTKLSHFQIRFNSVVDRARTRRSQIASDGTLNETNARAVVPAHLYATQDLKTLDEHY